MAKTRACAVLKNANLAYELLGFQPTFASRGKRAFLTAKGLGVQPGNLLKTIVLQTDKDPIVALLPADRKLHMPSLAVAAGVKWCRLLPKEQAEALTGYTVGGISPIAQRTSLRVFMDCAAEHKGFVVCSAGQEGLQIKLHPADLAKVCDVNFAQFTIEEDLESLSPRYHSCT